MRQISTLGLELIKKCEGLALTSYQDIGGVWTIGYGHTAPDVVEGMHITELRAIQYLLQDVTRSAAAVETFVKVPLSDNQFGALACFVYNVGIANFRKSTLLRLLNEKKYKEAADQFVRWNKVNGKPVTGLTKRRKAERDLFLL